LVVNSVFLSLPFGKEQRKILTTKDTKDTKGQPQSESVPSFVHVVYFVVNSVLRSLQFAKEQREILTTRDTKDTKEDAHSRHPPSLATWW
jgi:hypothetical protein